MERPLPMPSIHPACFVLDRDGIAICEICMKSCRHLATQVGHLDDPHFKEQPSASTMATSPGPILQEKEMELHSPVSASANQLTNTWAELPPFPRPNLCQKPPASTVIDQLTISSLPDQLLFPRPIFPVEERIELHSLVSSSANQPPTSFEDCISKPASPDNVSLKSDFKPCLSNLTMENEVMTNYSYINSLRKSQLNPDVAKILDSIAAVSRDLLDCFYPEENGLLADGSISGQ